MGVGGRGYVPWNENTNAPSRVRIYKLIENINIIVFGTKSKHQEELNSDIACVTHYIFQQNRSSLKNKQSITQVNY